MNRRNFIKYLGFGGIAVASSVLAKNGERKSLGGYNDVISPAPVRERMKETMQDAKNRFVDPPTDITWYGELSSCFVNRQGTIKISNGSI